MAHRIETQARLKELRELARELQEPHEYSGQQSIGRDLDWLLDQYNDLRELLLAYTRLVLDSEGVDHIDSGGYAGDILVTSAQREMLRALAAEARERKPSDWPNGVVPRG